MEALRDILRTFRPVGGETLRVAGTGAEPFAAVDPRALRVEAEAGSSAHLVVLHTKRSEEHTSELSHERESRMPSSA